MYDTRQYEVSVAEGESPASELMKHRAWKPDVVTCRVSASIIVLSHTRSVLQPVPIHRVAWHASRHVGCEPVCLGQSIPQSEGLVSCTMHFNTK